MFTLSSPSTDHHCRHCPFQHFVKGLFECHLPLPPLPQYNELCWKPCCVAIQCDMAEYTQKPKRIPKSIHQINFTLPQDMLVQPTCCNLSLQQGHRSTPEASLHDTSTHYQLHHSDLSPRHGVKGANDLFCRLLKSA